LATPWGDALVAQKLGIGSTETVRKWVRRARSTPPPARGAHQSVVPQTTLVA
jgi:transposase-like protein